MGILRLVLAVGVVVWHARQPDEGFRYLLDGGVCVLMFFMISGFYMSMILHEKYGLLPDGRRRFFINRILRIFPLYFVVLALQQLDYSLAGAPTVFTGGIDMPAHSRVLFVVMNVFTLGQDYWQTLVQANFWPVRDLLRDALGVNALAPYPAYMLIGPAWSLGCELTFYGIAPFLLLRRWRWVAGVTALALFARLFLYSHYDQAALLTKFFPGVLVFFLLGHLSYLMLVRLRRWRRAIPASRLVTALVASVFVWNVAFNRGLFIGDGTDGWRMWTVYLLMIGVIPCLFLVTSGSAIDRVLGQSSYAVYLIHSLVITRMAALQSRYVMWPIVITTLALALLLTYLVERPVSAWRSRLALRTATR